jgi:hypothetical protein
VVYFLYGMDSHLRNREIDYVFSLSTLKSLRTPPRFKQDIEYLCGDFVDG